MTHIQRGWRTWLSTSSLDSPGMPSTRPAVCRDHLTRPPSDTCPDGNSVATARNHALGITLEAGYQDGHGSDPIGAGCRGSRSAEWRSMHPGSRDT